MTIDEIKLINDDFLVADSRLDLFHKKMDKKNVQSIIDYKIALKIYAKLKVRLDNAIDKYVEEMANGDL